MRGDTVMQVQQAIPLHSDTVDKHLCQHPHEPENEREQAYQIGWQVVGSHRRVGLPWPHQVWPSNALLHFTPCCLHQSTARPSPGGFFSVLVAEF